MITSFMNLFYMIFCLCLTLTIEAISREGGEILPYSKNLNSLCQDFSLTLQHVNKPEN